MLEKKLMEKMRTRGRVMGKAQTGDPELGPFSELPGIWKSLPGRGWNLIALPFESGQFNYRVLMNQYDEELQFAFVDKAVPNRGLETEGTGDGDQFVIALDYTQKIKQIAAADSPNSGLAGEPGNDIHHETGLFLHMLNRTTDGLDIARLATVPHGNAALGLGRAQTTEGPPTIPPLSALPIGATPDVQANPYLAPYKTFADTPFQNLFEPLDTNKLLRDALAAAPIKRTTVLHFDTTLDKAGISNIPFIEREADAAEMQSTFWIEELEETDENGDPVFQMQYSQVVMLDFIDRPDGNGLIRWPHVSINTLRRTSAADVPAV